MEPYEVYDYLLSFFEVLVCALVGMLALSASVSLAYYLWKSNTLKKND
jgi:hypothetical protein